MATINPAVLRRLSDEDLAALSQGDVSRLSDQGLQLLSSAAPKPMSAGERFAHRAITAPLDAGTQLAAHGNKWLSEATGGVVPRLQNDPSPEIAERQRDYQARKPEGMDWAGLAGDLLSPVNLGLMAIPGGTIPRAAMLGATTGLLEPSDAEDDDFWSDKAGQAALGAVGGGAANAAFRGVARAVSPNASRNLDLALLRKEGVRPTVGQALGGRLNAAEEKLTSVPIMGDMIASARGKARDGFNRAAINRATAPVGGKVGAVGQEGVDQAHRSIDAAYDAARASGPVRLDRQATQEVRQLAQQVARLGPEQQRAFQNLWADAATQVTPAGRIRDYKALTSMVGQDAANYRGSAAPLDRKLGMLLGEANDAIKGATARNNAPAAQAFSRADQGFSNLAIVENAAKSAKGSDGVFTPGQLLTAVQQSDKSARKNATARGLARMQDLGTAGQNVLGNKVPNSGTFDRAAMGGLTLGAAYLEPATLAGIAAGTIAYTPAIQRALVATVASRGPGAQKAAEILRQFAAHSAPVGASLLDD